MITIPVYELLLLPEVTFFFKKDVFPSGEVTAESVGEDILFVMEKEEKEQKKKRKKQKSKGRADGFCTVRIRRYRDTGTVAGIFTSFFRRSGMSGLYRRIDPGY